MKTLPLRELLRRPALVREITARGDGQWKGLWVVMPDAGELAIDEQDEAARSEWIDSYFDELAAQPVPVGATLFVRSAPIRETPCFTNVSSLP